MHQGNFIINFFSTYTPIPFLAGVYQEIFFLSSFFLLFLFFSFPIILLPHHFLATHRNHYITHGNGKRVRDKRAGLGTVVRIVVSATESTRYFKKKSGG
jgi:hypothetical protein